MANGFIVIKDRDWEKADSGQRDWMVFNTLKSIDARLTKLEKRPFYDKASSFVGGIIGGASAIMAKWIFFRD